MYDMHAYEIALLTGEAALPCSNKRLEALLSTTMMSGVKVREGNEQLYAGHTMTALLSTEFNQRDHHQVQHAIYCGVSLQIACRAMQQRRQNAGCMKGSRHTLIAA